MVWLCVALVVALCVAIRAAYVFQRSQQEAWARTGQLGWAVQSYTLRVVSVLDRHPELTSDPDLCEALLPTPLEAADIRYSPSIEALLPEWRRGEGILSPKKCSPEFAAYFGIQEVCRD